MLKTMVTKDKDELMSLIKFNGQVPANLDLLKMDPKLISNQVMIVCKFIQQTSMEKYLSYVDKDTHDLYANAYINFWPEQDPYKPSNQQLLLSHYAHESFVHMGERELALKTVARQYNRELELKLDEYVQEELLDMLRHNFMPHSWQAEATVLHLFKYHHCTILKNSGAMSILKHYAPILADKHIKVIYRECMNFARDIDTYTRMSDDKDLEPLRLELCYFFLDTLEYLSGDKALELLQDHPLDCDAIRTPCCDKDVRRLLSRCVEDKWDKVQFAKAAIQHPLALVKQLMDEQASPEAVAQMLLYFPPKDTKLGQLLAHKLMYSINDESHLLVVVQHLVKSSSVLAWDLALAILKNVMEMGPFSESTTKGLLVLPTCLGNVKQEQVAGKRMHVMTRGLVEMLLHLNTCPSDKWGLQMALNQAAIIEMLHNYGEKEVVEVSLAKAPMVKMFFGAQNKPVLDPFAAVRSAYFSSEAEGESEISQITRQDLVTHLPWMLPKEWRILGLKMAQRLPEVITAVLVLASPCVDLHANHLMYITYCLGDCISWVLERQQLDLDQLLNVNQGVCHVVNFFEEPSNALIMCQVGIMSKILDTEEVSDGHLKKALAAVYNLKNGCEARHLSLTNIQHHLKTKK